MCGHGETADDEDNCVDIMDVTQEVEHGPPIDMNRDIINLLITVLDVLYNNILNINCTGWTAAVRDEYTEYRGV